MRFAETVSVNRQDKLSFKWLRSFAYIVDLKNIKECYKRSVPDDFLSSKIESLESVINKLSAGVECQAMIDKIYSELETVLKSEMMEKLDFKVITYKWGMNNKR